MLATGIQYSPPEELATDDRVVIDALHQALNADERVHSGLLIANYRIPGAVVADCDILLMLNFHREAGLVLEVDGLRATFRNLLLLLELKQSERCEFRNGDVVVEYANGKRKNASHQSKQTIDNLNDYLRSQRVRFDFSPPFVYGAVYLPRIGPQSGAEHPAIASRVLFGQPLNLERLLRLAVAQRRLEIEAAGARELSSWPAANLEKSVAIYERIRAAIGASSEPPVFGPIDRKRLEQITSTVLTPRADYLDDAGSRMLVFHGQAGTGKTTRLLQLAESLRNGGASCLFLTYNLALAQDIRYVQMILANDGLRDAMPVETIGSVVYQLAIALASDEEQAALKAKYADDYLKGYAMAWKAVLAVIDSADAEAARQMCREGVANLDQEFYLIDEGQDWTLPEMKIVHWLAGGGERMAVAVGPDQVQRGHRADWKRLDGRARLINCPRNLRQKPSLHRFNHNLSMKLGEAWTENELQSDPGAVRIIADAELGDEAFWTALEAQLAAAGVSPRDVLIAEPGGLDPKEQSATILASHRRQCWNGSDREIRRGAAMLRPEEYRIVKYESTRGLESWVAILRMIDEQANVRAYRHGAHGKNIDDLTKKKTMRDLRVSTTRPIDTLIITYGNAKHWVVQELKGEG